MNSPLMWYYRFRSFPHKKDEALAMDIPFVSAMPLPPPSAALHEGLDAVVVELIPKQDRVLTARVAIHDWLRIEFGIDRPGRALEAPEWLDADSFVAAVRAALPRRRHLSAAEIARIKREHAETVAPARQAAAEALRLERRLSDLVNQAYGLTPEEVALMWSTAPPRMPLVAPATPHFERDPASGRRNSGTSAVGE